jgi:hypothetical protein
MELRSIPLYWDLRPFLFACIMACLIGCGHIHQLDNMFARLDLGSPGHAMGQVKSMQWANA